MAEGRGPAGGIKQKIKIKNTAKMMIFLHDGKQGNCVCSRLGEGALYKNQTNDKISIC